jgi:hypothetical protein
VDAEGGGELRHAELLLGALERLQQLKGTVDGLHAVAHDATG